MLDKKTLLSRVNDIYRYIRFSHTIIMLFIWNIDCHAGLIKSSDYQHIGETDQKGHSKHLDQIYALYFQSSEVVYSYLEITQRHVCYMTSHSYTEMAFFFYRS